MVISEERKNNETSETQKFNAKHNFLLLAKMVDGDQIECLLISDGKLKKHFMIYRNEKGFHRKDIFHAKEFRQEEKEITSESTIKFKVILEVFEEQFFFTEKSEGRHFDQIAKMLWEEFGLDNNK